MKKNQSYRPHFLILFIALLCLAGLGMPKAVLAGEKITIAAAADLSFAMNEIVALFKKQHPKAQVQVIYGSSGKFFTQIQQGAPYDLYFSADIAYPRELKAKGFGGSEVSTYAFGRIVLWSAHPGPKLPKLSKLSLKALSDPLIRKIAIANPKHAPYGKRAEEALKAAGVWDTVKTKLIYGENVAQTAQFVQSGNAEVGIIALSLALSPPLLKQGSYVLIPEVLHQKLEQGYILTARAAQNPLAKSFSTFMQGKSSEKIMGRYGFVLPAK